VQKQVKETSAQRWNKVRRRRWNSWL